VKRILYMNETYGKIYKSLQLLVTQIVLGLMSTPLLEKYSQLNIMNVAGNNTAKKDILHHREVIESYDYNKKVKPGSGGIIIENIKNDICKS
jgi:hypothetical protein